MWSSVWTLRGLTREGIVDLDERCTGEDAIKLVIKKVRRMEGAVARFQPP